MFHLPFLNLLDRKYCLESYLPFPPVFIDFMKCIAFFLFFSLSFDQRWA